MEGLKFIKRDGATFPPMIRLDYLLELINHKLERKSGSVPFYNTVEFYPIGIMPRIDTLSISDPDSIGPVYDGGFYPLKVIISSVYLEVMEIGYESWASRASLFFWYGLFENRLIIGIPVGPDPGRRPLVGC